MAEKATGPPTRPTLLRRIHDANDREAWQTFVDVYGPLVYRHARSRGLQDADAAEITQEVLFRVSRAIRQFEYDSGRGSFREWLGTVTHNRIRSFLQKEAGVIHGRGEDDAEDVLQGLPASEQDTEWTEEFNRHLLDLALRRCRPYFEERTWRAFELVWLQDRSAAEVARELGQKINWVYLMKSRVLKRLQQEVQELAEDIPQLLR
jgi:RNA polymerase sigma factor (sigma-70 family)